MDVVSRKNVTATEVLDYLEDDEELTQQQQTALEYLQKHVTIQDAESAEKLMDELEDLDAFTDKQIIKILEVLPTTEREVRSLFSKERIKLDDSNIENVINFSESVREQ